MVMNFVTGELQTPVCAMRIVERLCTVLGVVSTVSCGSDMSPNNPRKCGPGLPNNCKLSSSFSDEESADHKGPARTRPPASETPHKALF
jgi:hypothetical protein